MNLSASIKSDIRGARAELAAMREEASKIGHSFPGSAPLATSIMQHGCALAAYLNGIEQSASAARAVGALDVPAQQEAAESLPLFAAAARSETAPSMALLRSLHRAADHTLDPSKTEN